MDLIKELSKGFVNDLKKKLYGNVTGSDDSKNNGFYYKLIFIKICLYYATLKPNYVIN